MNINNKINTRKSALLVLLICSGLPVFGQTRLLYRDTTGSKIEYYTIDLNNGTDGYHIETDMQVYECDRDFNTLSWNYSPKDENTNFTALLENGSIHISGVKNGEEFDKVIEIDPTVNWIQTAFEFGPVQCLTGTRDFEFYMLNPDDLKISRMRGFIKKEEDVIEVNGNSTGAVRTIITLPGFAGNFWSANYWLRQNDGRLLLYKIKKGALAKTSVVELVSEQ